jgi:hypothetical protein
MDKVAAGYQAAAKKARQARAGHRDPGLRRPRAVRLHAAGRRAGPGRAGGGCRSGCTLPRSDGRLMALPHRQGNGAPALIRVLVSCVPRAPSPAPSRPRHSLHWWQVHRTSPPRRVRCCARSRCWTNTASAAACTSRRTAADGVHRQARAGHADDAGRLPRTAGAGLPAEPAPGGQRGRGGIHHRRLGRRRRCRQDPRRHRRLEARTAHRVVTTGCGQGTVFGDAMDAAGQRPPARCGHGPHPPGHAARC